MAQQKNIYVPFHYTCAERQTISDEGIKCIEARFAFTLEVADSNYNPGEDNGFGIFFSTLLGG